jgi:membrane protein DedA with SNARE-associated domain
VVQDLIATYGLLAVFVLMAAESACIPVPSEVTMLFAGALAADAVSGPHASLAAVIVAGTLGNVVGSYLAWLMGKYGGRPGLTVGGTMWGCTLERSTEPRTGLIGVAHRWCSGRGYCQVSEPLSLFPLV